LTTKGTDPMNRIEIEAMMKADSNDLMTLNGVTRTIGEHLRAILKGEGVPYEPAPEPQGAPGQQPGQRGSIRIDPARLTEAQRSELESTGQIAGFTASDRGRAMISVRNSSGSIRTDFSFNPETGAVEPGRPMDLRMFQDPNAVDSK
jgi:hypothetical protein